jgi:hypothetical protein
VINLSATDTVPRVVIAAQRFNKLLQGEDYAFAPDIDEDAERIALVKRVMNQIKLIEKRVCIQLFKLTYMLIQY